MLIPLNTPSFPQTLIVSNHNVFENLQIPRANFPLFGLSVALPIAQKNFKHYY